MGENLTSRIQYWLNEAKYDCFFVVGPENGPTERIGALKTLLMGDSEPLRAMLQDSEMAEKKDIRLIDVEPETFWNFLKCTYGASNILIPKLNFEQSAKLLYIVEKYLVDDVKSVLTQHLNDIFSTDTLFVALSYPVCYQEKGLEKRITEILKYDFMNVTSNDQFLELDYTAIKWILEVQSPMVKEVEVWKAVVRWAKHKFGSFGGEVLRSQMLGLLKYIRFLSMDQREFSEYVVSSEILSKEEINYICSALVLGRRACKQLNKNRRWRHCASKKMNKIRCRKRASKKLNKNRCSRLSIAPVSKHTHSSFMEFPHYAYFRCSVNDVSKLQTHHTHSSETYCWASHVWNLQYTRKPKRSSTGNAIDFLNVFLVCEGMKSIWECTVDLEIMLINHSTKGDKRVSCSKTFCPLSRWVSYCMIGWTELINPDSGFVKDDCIIILARLQLKDI